MSIAITLRKYTGDAEPFIKLLYRLCHALHSQHRLNVRYDDYQARKLIKESAREIVDARHPEPDLKILIEDVVGDLVNRLVEHGAVFQIAPDSGPRATARGQRMATYMKTHFYEYLSVQVGLFIVQEMLGSELITPNPTKILDAAVIIQKIPERAPYFIDLLGLSSVVEDISNS